MADGISVIIPARDEEAAIAQTLADLAATSRDYSERLQVIVVDNGSKDRTAEVASRCGARVVAEPRRGYGQACLAGIAALPAQTEIVAFMDADGSDDPSDLAGFVGPIERGQVDLVIGSRLRGAAEASSLTPAQRFGNRLATLLLRALYGARCTDLGPFRAIRREALERLRMSDTNYGWTVEMQIKAQRAGLRVLEVPVRYRRRRAGKSKVSGSLRGSVLAGAKIIWTILRLTFAGNG